MISEFYDWWIAQVEADADTEQSDPLDNEAYRRDFPELEYNRWEDDGGSYTTVETTKFGDAEPTSIRIYEPGRKTLGELVDEKINLAASVSDDTQVSVAAEGRYTVIVVVRGDNE